MIQLCDGTRGESRALLLRGAFSSMRRMTTAPEGLVRPTIVRTDPVVQAVQPPSADGGAGPPSLPDYADVTTEVCARSTERPGARPRDRALLLRMDGPLAGQPHRLGRTSFRMG